MRAHGITRSTVGLGSEITFESPRAVRRGEQHRELHDNPTRSGTGEPLAAAALAKARKIGRSLPQEAGIEDLATIMRADGITLATIGLGSEMGHVPEPWSGPSRCAASQAP